MIETDLSSIFYCTNAAIGGMRERNFGRIINMSSIIGQMGNIGQANYAAASVCLDALAQCRRGRGVSGVSVQWGAWAEVGMAARGAAGARMSALEASSGFGRISLSYGLTALHAVVQPGGAAVVGVLRATWSRVLADGSAAPSFLSALLPSFSVVAPAAVMVRKLKYHEATLLRKVDFINWKSDQSVRENKILRRYHVQDREDYHTYNKVVGLITKCVTQLKGLDERDPVRIEVTDLLLDKLYDRHLGRRGRRGARRPATDPFDAAAVAVAVVAAVSRADAAELSPPPLVEVTRPPPRDRDDDCVQWCAPS